MTDNGIHITNREIFDKLEALEIAVLTRFAAIDRALDARPTRKELWGGLLGVAGLGLAAVRLFL